MNAAEFSLVQDWQFPAAWPVEFEYSATLNQSNLLVIEQSGIDLTLIDEAGIIHGTPGSNVHGPNFVIAPAGQITRLFVDQATPNSPPGGFRILVLPLDNIVIQQAAQMLVSAGSGVESSDQAIIEAACANYFEVAGMDDIPVELAQASGMLSAECDRFEGNGTSQEFLDSFSTTNYPLGFKSYHADWFRGRVAFSNEDYDEARKIYNRVISQAMSDLEQGRGPEIGLELDIASIYINLGSVDMIQGYLDGSSETARMLERADENLDLAIARAGMFDGYTIMGEAYRTKSAVALVRDGGPAVLENLLLARDMLSKAGDSLALVYANGSIGDYYKEWGDLKLAQESYLESLEVVKRTNSENRTADPFHNMSTLYYTLGDFPRARDMVIHAQTVYENLGNVARSNMLNFDLASILIEQGQFQQALGLLEDLLAFLLARSVPWDPIRIETQSALASLERKLGRVEQALAYSTEVFNYLESERIGTTGFEVVPVYVTHALLLADNNKPEVAAAVLQYALDSLASETADKIQVLAALHDVYADLGDTSNAIAIADRSFELIESQQMEIESVRLGPYWNGKMQEFYMSHADYLLSLNESGDGFPERAFAVVERAKAASLRLRRQEVVLSRTQDDSQARREWQDMVESIRRGAGKQDSDADALRLERSISEARERFFLSYSDTLERLYPEMAGLDDIQGNLDTHTLVMEFVTGPENVWRFDIAATGWKVTNIGAMDMVTAAVDAALFEITSRPAAPSRNTDYLSSLLFAGMEIPANVDSLLVSPTGNMNSIPFSALKYDNRYVAELATVTLLPSISEYFSGSGIPEKSPGNLSLAVFADPVFGSEMTADLAFVDTEPMRSWSDTLERLPASGLEARALQAFYTAEESLVLTGAEATQANLFNERVRNANIIHIATHGYFNESLPELIGLALASADSQDDGFVSMAEISTQDFNADLVVISACSTARGEVIPGEGNMSLARTFLAQGVNSVVSTLWPVSDSATALFMKEFYRAINVDGFSYDNALQSAQNRLRESSRYQSPFYWGAYILTSASPS